MRLFLSVFVIVLVVKVVFANVLFVEGVIAVVVVVKNGCRYFCCEIAL